MGVAGRRPTQPDDGRSKGDRKMTREQKIEWLANANNEEVIEQLRWAVHHMDSDNLKTKIEGNEDYKLVKAELMKRLSK